MTRTTKRVALALMMSATLGSGCARSLSGTVDATRSALHVVPVVAEDAAKGWAKQVDARIAYCREQGATTPEARAQCMGIFGRGDAWEADFEALRAAYDLAADALEQLSRAAKRVEARAAGRKADAEE